MNYNFSSGPAMLPKAVMQQIHDEWFNWQESGLSVVEWSHRDKTLEPMIHETKALIAELLDIPKNYKVLFMQGGASLMWSTIPMNIAWGKKVGHVVTGSWSNKAIIEAKKYAEVKLVASAENAEGKFVDIADVKTWGASDDLSYIHFCTNETIQGIQYRNIPLAANINVPLVSDMSSDIFSRALPIEKFGAIYAGSQKNLGVAGLTVLIIREDWLSITHEKSTYIPNTLNFNNIHELKSLLNTPCTFAIYSCNLVLKWIRAQGGVKAMERQNQEKAHLLYSYIDNSDLYQSVIEKRARSYMNVSFSLRGKNNQELQNKWLEEAKEAGLYQLKGHRLQGGLRASIYNAMPKAGVERLIQFMDDFTKKHADLL